VSENQVIPDRELRSVKGWYFDAPKLCDKQCRIAQCAET